VVYKSSRENLKDIFCFFSWDRVVEERCILKNSEDNKLVMKRLADAARELYV
jgi:hypothetical protein